jgi:hypothetical protein
MALRSERRFISKYDITTGMLLEFSYIKDKDKKPANYMVLVIDPEKLHDSTDNAHLHGILIKDLSDLEIVRISTEIGQEFNYNPDERRVPITMLQSDEAYARYRTSSIKKDRLYRTFLVDSITNVRQILIGELE